MNSENYYSRKNFRVQIEPQIKMVKKLVFKKSQFYLKHNGFIKEAVKFGDKLYTKEETCVDHYPIPFCITVQDYFQFRRQNHYISFKEFHRENATLKVVPKWVDLERGEKLTKLINKNRSTKHKILALHHALYQFHQIEW